MCTTPEICKGNISSISELCDECFTEMADAATEEWAKKYLGKKEAVPA